MKTAAMLLCLAAGLMAAGCASTRSTPSPEAIERLDAMNAGLRDVVARTPAAPAARYVVDPPDVIAIHVKDNKDLSADAIVVGPDGVVSRPLVGTVRVGGRTVEDIQIELKDRYSQYIRDAEVTVMVTGFHSKWIYVDGEVRSPGRYAYTGGDSVVGLIAQAGFLTRRAAPNDIRVARGNRDDPELHPVRLSDIVVEGDDRTNLLLAPDDIVHVPPSFISKVGYLFEEIFFPLQNLIAPAATYVTYREVRD